MGTLTAPAPWKQLLLGAMESNSHLRHSSYIQLATIGCNGRPSNRTVVFRGFQEDSDKIQIHTDCRSRKIEELKNCPFAEICWYFTDSWEQFRISGTVDMVDGSNPDPVKLEDVSDTAEILVSMLDGMLNMYSSNPVDSSKGCRARMKDTVFLSKENPTVEHVAKMWRWKVYVRRLSDVGHHMQREKSWFSTSLRSRLQYLGPHPGLPNLSEETPAQVFLDPSAGPAAAFCVLFLDPQQVDFLNLKSNQRVTFSSTQSPNGDKCWTSERELPKPELVFQPSASSSSSVANVGGGGGGGGGVLCAHASLALCNVT